MFSYVLIVLFLTMNYYTNNLAQIAPHKVMQDTQSTMRVTNHFFLNKKTV